MYKYLLIFLILFLLPVQAFELDTSVDEEIRKNYNPSILEQKLPALPKTSPTQIQSNTKSTPPKNLPVINGTSNNFTPVDKTTAIRVKKGTKFKVKSGSYLADTTKIGTNIYFTTQNPVYQTYITIPAGTVFSAVVTDSHPPQITGNGGLLEIEITGAYINNNTYGADGKITKANYKKIFFNNIKGKRQYWKGVANQVNKGQKFYNKTKSAASKLSQNPITNLISPVPTIFGAGVYVVNLVSSPIFSICSKGGKLSIPAGSEFEIKLKDDLFIQ